MNVCTNWLPTRLFASPDAARRKQRRNLGASTESCEHRALLSAHIASSVVSQGHESPDAKKPPKKFGGTWTISTEGNPDTIGTFTQKGKHVAIELNYPTLIGPFSATGTIGKNRHLTASMEGTISFPMGPSFPATESVDISLTDRTHMTGSYSISVFGNSVQSGSFTGTKV